VKRRRGRPRIEDYKNLKPDAERKREKRELEKSLLDSERRLGVVHHLYRAFRGLNPLAPISEDELTKFHKQITADRKAIRKLMSRPSASKLKRLKREPA
jgi:hypothetical protein